MSKIGEFYCGLYLVENLGQPKKPHPRQSHKKPKPQIEGQMSFDLATDGAVVIRDDEKERAIKRKEALLKYYDCFHDLLNKYGRLNESLNLLECIESSQDGGTPMSDNVRNALNYHYDGEIKNVENAVKRAHHWRKKAAEKFEHAAQAVNIFDATSKYDTAYRDKARRDRFRTVVNRETIKVRCLEDEKAILSYQPWTPQDLEDDYQCLRLKRERDAEAIARGEKKPRKKPTKKSES